MPKIYNTLTSMERGHRELTSIFKGASDDTLLFPLELPQIFERPPFNQPPATPSVESKPTSEVAKKDSLSGEEEQVNPDKTSPIKEDEKIPPPRKSQFQSGDKPKKKLVAQEILHRRSEEQGKKDHPRPSVIQKAPVIQRAPVVDAHRLALELPYVGPMQEYPIDCRVPKKPNNNEGKRPLSAFSKMGRTRSSPMCGGGGGGTLHFGGSGGGQGHIDAIGGGGGGCGGGVMGNGGGGGDMGCGNGRLNNYGTSSPPSASLPPFYESLKSNSYTMPIEIAGMSQGNPLHNFEEYRPKQYQQLQNCTYDLDPNDSSQELEIKASLERDPLPSMNLMNINNFPRYIENMIDDYHFTAHMNMTPLTDKNMIQEMQEVADLLLQRIPNADEPLSNDSMSSITSPMEPNVQPYPENQVLMQKDRLNNNVFNKLLSQNYNPPPKGSLTEVNQQLEIQVQLHTQQQLSNEGTNLLDVDGFHTVLTPTSLPSPVNSPENLRSCLNTPGPSSVSSSRRESSASISSLSAGILKDDPEGLIERQLGIPINTPLEFVNGGHGIKNPLANHDRMTGSRGSATAAPADEEKSQSEEGTCRTFSCRVCSKSFGLQRLLNRHMKCHSDVKRYLCSFCCKGFNDTFDLKRHTRTHTGVRPYKCNLCEKSFTQRCSLESHCLKVHNEQHSYAYKERRSKMYVCEECGHTTGEPEVHYVHLKDLHPTSPSLLKFYDKRHFKFTNSNFASMLVMRS
ncbi:transcriptional regulator ovo-like isoform X2 [Cloeon dipterum]|uniref:transcriptional regulator ovo-like isoform X2 n=1 Tax=Cloeon dipterum TaxID=197152 RepID=UPI003220873E